MKDVTTIQIEKTSQQRISTHGNIICESRKKKDKNNKTIARISTGMSKHEVTA